MKRYRTSLCCRSGMSYRMARTLSRIAKLGEKAVARSHCAQNRNILFKCPRWSFMFLLPTGQATQGTLFGGIGSAGRGVYRSFCNFPLRGNFSGYRGLG